MGTVSSEGKDGRQSRGTCIADITQSFDSLSQEKLYIDLEHPGEAEEIACNYYPGTLDEAIASGINFKVPRFGIFLLSNGLMKIPLAAH